jgi:(E)-4-hydroxy-3-methylbut-2-enyl-diphosphate synthase
MIELAIRYDKPVRIGANWGSLDQELLTALMDENAASRHPARTPRVHARGDHPVGAALGAARRGDRPGRDKIILSAKVSACRT